MEERHEKVEVILLHTCVKDSDSSDLLLHNSFMGGCSNPL